MAAAYALIRMAGNKVIRMPASSGTIRYLDELFLNIVNGTHRAGIMHVHNFPMVYRIYTIYTVYMGVSGEHGILIFC